MKHRGIAATTATAGLLALAGCGSAGTHPAASAVAATATAAVPAPSSAAANVETPIPTPIPPPTRTTARTSAAPTPTPRKPTTAPHATATPPSTGGGSAGKAWTWSPNTPPQCTPREAPKAGAFIQSILVRNPVDNSAAWNGWVGDDNACFAYAVGLTDPVAKTIQLLVMDTNTRAQKAFTGHLGDSVGVGRFTIKIQPSTGNYGPTLFEPGFYWN